MKNTLVAPWENLQRSIERHSLDQLLLMKIFLGNSLRMTMLENSQGMTIFENSQGMTILEYVFIIAPEVPNNKIESFLTKAVKKIGHEQLLLENESGISPLCLAFSNPAISFNLIKKWIIPLEEQLKKRDNYALLQGAFKREPYDFRACYYLAYTLNPQQLQTYFDKFCGNRDVTSEIIYFFLQLGADGTSKNLSTQETSFERLAEVAPSVYNEVLLKGLTQFLQDEEIIKFLENNKINEQPLNEIISTNIPINIEEDKDEDSELHCACLKIADNFEEAMQAVELLLKKRSNPLIKNKNGLTPLQLSENLIQKHYPASEQLSYYKKIAGLFGDYLQDKFENIYVNYKEDKNKIKHIVEFIENGFDIDGINKHKEKIWFDTIENVKHRIIRSASFSKEDFYLSVLKSRFINYCVDSSKENFNKLQRLSNQHPEQFNNFFKGILLEAPPLKFLTEKIIWKSKNENLGFFEKCFYSSCENKFITQEVLINFFEIIISTEENPNYEKAEEIKNKARKILKKTHPNIAETFNKIVFLNFILDAKDLNNKLCSQHGTQELHKLKTMSFYGNERFLTRLFSTVQNHPEFLVGIAKKFELEQMLMPNEKGNTPFHCAFFNSSIPFKILSQLIDENFIENRQLCSLKNSKNNLSLLHAACCRIQIDFDSCHLLLKKGLDPHSADKEGRTPLDVACSNESVTLELIQLLITEMENKKPNNKLDLEKYLYTICKNPKVTKAMILFFIKKGAAPYSKNLPENKSAFEILEKTQPALFKELNTNKLHIACSQIKHDFNKAIEAIQLELKEGTNPLIKNKEGQTPLQMTEKFIETHRLKSEQLNNYKTIADLFGKALESDFKENFNCKQNNKQKIFDEFIRFMSNGFDIDSIDIETQKTWFERIESEYQDITISSESKENFYLAVIRARFINCCTDNSEANFNKLKQLSKEHGAEFKKFFNEKLILGIPPIHYLIRSKNNIAFYEWSCDTGADLSRRSHDDLTLLHKACSLNPINIQLIKFLAEKGTNISALDRNNCTPFHYALRNRSVTTEVIKFLTESIVNKESNELNQNTFPLLTEYCSQEICKNEIIQILLTDLKNNRNIEAKEKLRVIDNNITKNNLSNNNKKLLKKIREEIQEIENKKIDEKFEKTQNKNNKNKVKNLSKSKSSKKNRNNNNGLSKTEIKSSSDKSNNSDTFSQSNKVLINIEEKTAKESTINIETQRCSESKNIEEHIIQPEVEQENMFLDKNDVPTEIKIKSDDGFFNKNFVIITKNSSEDLTVINDDIINLFSAFIDAEENSENEGSTLDRLFQLIKSIEDMDLLGTNPDYKNMTFLQSAEDFFIHEKKDIQKNIHKYLKFKNEVSRFLQDKLKEELDKEVPDFNIFIKICENGLDFFTPSNQNSTETWFEFVTKKSKDSVGDLWPSFVETVVHNRFINFCLNFEAPLNEFKKLLQDYPEEIKKIVKTGFIWGMKSVDYLTQFRNDVLNLIETPKISKNEQEPVTIEQNKSLGFWTTDKNGDLVNADNEIKEEISQNLQPVYIHTSNNRHTLFQPEPPEKIKVVYDPAPDQDGNTQLHLLCRDPLVNLETIKSLLEKKADPTVKNKLGESPDSIIKTILNQINARLFESTEQAKYLFNQQMEVASYRYSVLCNWQIAVQQNILVQSTLQTMEKGNYSEFLEKAPLVGQKQEIKNYKMREQQIKFDFTPSPQLIELENNIKFYEEFRKVLDDIIYLFENCQMKPCSNNFK